LGIAAVSIPILVRLVPELLAGPYPLGFDTIWFYAPFVKSVEAQGLSVALANLVSTHSAPSMFVLLGIVASISGADPILITKLFGPILQGFLVFSMYYFARRGLGWNNRMCLLLIVLSSLYFVSLRFSWDLFRNTLGYGFVIMALAHVRLGPVSIDRWRLLALAGATLLASEFAAVLLGVLVGIAFCWEMIRYRKVNLYLLGITIVASIAGLFYLNLIFPNPPPKTPLAISSSGSPVVYNYLNGSGDVYNYLGLGDLYATVLLLSGMVLGPLLPLAWAGFYREKRLIMWTISLSVGAFSLLFIPFAGIPGWYRWLLMLALPLLLFSVKGVMKMRREITVIFLVLVAILSVGFVSFPPNNAFPYYTNSHTLPYVPSSMLQNTIPLQDSADTVKALRWLNHFQSLDSVLVTHIAFQGWALIYSTNPDVYGYVDAAQVDHGNFSSYRMVFLLYWAPNQGWYNQRLMPSNMTEVYQTGRIGVYEKSP
jgi:hypothetical protein